MKVTTYLAKYYDVYVRDYADVKAVKEEAVEGEEHIELYDDPDDCEPIGWLVRIPKRATYEWRNIYGDIATGTMMTETEVKQHAKAGLFYKKSQMNKSA